MSASQILLAGHGQEDQWLSDTPNMTYFEAKYTPTVNRSRATYEIPFDNQVTFDSTGRCTIPVKGDYMSRLTLRTVMPPIYPTVSGQYVFPTPSSQVGATVYVDMRMTAIVADGVTLTANTVGNHYFSIGAQVTLAGTAYVIFDLDGTYTITGIPTANSFTCSTVLAGISYNGIVSSPGIQCGDIISYFSTTNSNLWVNNVTNKTWQITGGTNVGNVWTFTTSAPSNFPVGSSVILNLPSNGILNETFTIISSTDTTFNCILNDTFVMSNDINGGQQAWSNDGKNWSFVSNPLVGNWFLGITYGNGVFVMVSTDGRQAWSYSGKIWTYVLNPLPGSWFGAAYGNGVFVMVGTGVQAWSNDGKTWTSVTSPRSGQWNQVTYGNGVFVMVCNGNQAWSSDGKVWTAVASPLSGLWTGVGYGNGIFFMACSTIQTYAQAWSTDGQIWTFTTTPSLTGSWYGAAYGNGIYVLTSGNGLQIWSSDGKTWTSVASPLPGSWYSTTYGNGIFVMVSGNNLGLQAWSNDGKVWNYVTNPLPSSWFGVTYGSFVYNNSLSDSVSLLDPPLQLTNRTFSSGVYPSISFADAADAAFWGFDSREGLTYPLPALPPWTYTQSGWISGFLPPSTSTYDDSVAHKLCKAVRVLVGKQTIKEYSGEYIELQNDLLIPYENKAILKLMNGTLDQTQATVAREYYVNLPFGTKDVPLCALTHQHMSVEVDFDSYLNLSQNLNQGTGDFLDAKSYKTYNASTGILGGQPINVQTTFSYQQYIFIVTYDGQFIIYDTTKDVADPTSYIVLSAFSGSSLFKQFCVLAGNLYIGLSDGTLALMIISELIQGIISSFALNNYTPTIGTLTGTMVADFRYVYYTVSNTASSNVFMTRYDTTGGFTSTGSYTTVDFTKTFNSSVTGVYQTLSTGTELIMLPQGVPGSLYTYQLNANVQSQWYVLSYYLYGSQITEGVLIGNALYFVCDNFSILKYSDSIFYVSSYFSPVFVMVSADDKQAWSTNKTVWTLATNPLSGGWVSVTYGNGVFVMVAGDSQAWSNDGKTWTSVASPLSGYWFGVTYGNGRFVMCRLFSAVQTAAWSDDGKVWNYATNSLIGYWGIGPSYGNGVFVVPNNAGNQQAWSNDGNTWYYATVSLPGSWYGAAYGNGLFVMVTNNQQAWSNDGKTWNYATVSLSGGWYAAAYGNGVFVMVSYDGQQAWSNDGKTWTLVTSLLAGDWSSVTYGTGSGFVMVGSNIQAWSNDGKTWNYTVYSFPGSWQSTVAAPSKEIISGDGLRNLIAVGNYIYCSTNNVAVQIDTTQDLSTDSAYEYPAPLPINQYIFANGPRYVYLFAQGDNTATNIVEFDPYGPDTTFKASILVDYESLPPEVPKPDKALIGIVQTQKVTDFTNMNITGPVKELWVMGPSATTNVFQYSNLETYSTLELAGEKIVTDDDGTHTFLNIIEPFETHTSMPIRNVSVISFEFDPESAVPNGTVNFSRIRDQNFEGGAETLWARNYNILKIQGGIGGLIFNS